MVYCAADSKLDTSFVSFRAWRPKEVATFTSYLENKINLKGICNGIKVNTPERLKDEIEKEKERKRSGKLNGR